MDVAMQNRIKVQFDTREVDRLVQEAIQEANLMNTRYTDAFYFASVLKNSISKHMTATFDDNCCISNDSKHSIIKIAEVYIWKRLFEEYEKAQKIRAEEKLTIFNPKGMIKINADELNADVNSFINNWFSFIRAGIKHGDQEDYIQRACFEFMEYMYIMNIVLNKEFSSFAEFLKDLNAVTDDVNIVHNDICNSASIFDERKSAKKPVRDLLDWICGNSNLISTAFGTYEGKKEKPLDSNEIKILKHIYRYSNENCTRMQKIVQIIRAFVSPANVFMNYEYSELSDGFGIAKFWEGHTQDKPFDIFSNLEKIRDKLEKDNVKRSDIICKIENEMNCKGDVTHQMMEYAYISAYNLVCRIFASLSKYSQNN
ncbi:hypothetical protein NEMIN01_2122, partial [Nematocida minor]|uniref:uncharacterized protein n=1 Tax=Nematocida minor TaxID=1912983 RepID=UPI00221FDAB9